nr:methionine gamma-lyase-like [Ipomoea batatas]GME17966.1 methionine gamma-lyase-like [Ipomoea batatas]GME17968.1 methionine gamma-lyase-like [Ipomoea batatas]
MWDDLAMALASARDQFGEYGSMNMSIKASTTFTVMELAWSHCIGCSLGSWDPTMINSSTAGYSNPIVLNVSRLTVTMEGTEAAYCTASGLSSISSVLL